ncbi:MAG: FtsX-like permease family protein [Promethearchaeota archaeon]
MSITRLIGKSFILASRARKRFISFCIVYSVLIALCAYTISQVIPHLILNDGETPTTQAYLFMAVTIVASLLMSIFYALIIINYRKTEIATLKCLGWKNNHVRTLIVGEIFSVTLVGFIIIVEGVFHWIALYAYFDTAGVDLGISEAASYLPSKNLIPIDFLSLVFTFGIILGVQIAGVLAANSKILKVRPIQALQMKE